MASSAFDEFALLEDLHQSISYMKFWHMSSVAKESTDIICSYCVRCIAQPNDDLDCISGNDCGECFACTICSCCCCHLIKKYYVDVIREYFDPK